MNLKIKIWVVSFILLIWLTGCCQNQVTIPTANAIGIWKENTHYLNAALSDFISGKFPSLNRPVPGNGKHFCLTGVEEFKQKEQHLKHLSSLAKATNALSDRLDELAQASKCGD